MEEKRQQNCGALAQINIDERRITRFVRWRCGFPARPANRRPIFAPAGALSELSSLSMARQQIDVADQNQVIDRTGIGDD